jgi:hypothetical protein
METPALVALIAGGSLLLLVILVLIFRKGSKGGKKGPRPCQQCRRVMAAGWSKCLFCGWAPLPRLEFLCGPLAGQTLELREEVTTLGSISGNTIVLADPAVSKKHVGIRRMGEQYEVADLGSTNGIYVNGHKVPKKMLDLGDILRVGNSEMVFRRD